MSQLRKIKLIDSINTWVGSWIFLGVHIIWFIIWLTWRWDVNILTMIVSLEAIMLMIILLMSQNRQSMVDDLRDEADLQADLQSVALVEEVLREVRAMKRDIEELKK